MSDARPPEGARTAVRRTEGSLMSDARPLRRALAPQPPGGSSLMSVIRGQYLRDM
jgi:hypothetical protein